MAGRFSIEAVFKAVDKVTRPVTRMTGRIQKSMRSVRGGLTRMNAKLRQVGQTARQSLGVGGLAGSIALVGLAMTRVITKGAEFERALVGAAARFPEEIERGSAAFVKLEETARRVGATTEFTATQSAEGLNFLAKAGFNAEQAIALLPTTVDLATASELELGRASDIATDALGAFGLVVDDTTQLQANFSRVTDQMAKTTVIANTDMEQLFETIKKGAPAATAAGVSMETFLALTAQLASSGLKASDAGTALKNVFLRLADRGVQKKIRQLGVDVKDAQGEMRDFGDIMDDLNASLSSRTKIERAGIINELFGLRGVTAVTNVLTSGVDKFREYRKTITESEGSMAKLAATMRNTRQGQIDTMNSAIESLTLTISAANDTGISNLIVGVTAVTRALDGFIQRNPEVAKWAGILLAVAAAALVVGAVFAGLAAAIGFIAGSTTALVAIAVAASVAFGAWLSTLQPIQKWFDDFFAGGVVDKLAMVAKLITPWGLAMTLGEAVLGSDDEEPSAESIEVQTQPGPGARIARSISESRQTNSAELIVRPEGVSAELAGDLGPGVAVNVEPTGTF